jgi:hypothetical protein
MPGMAAESDTHEKGRVAKNALRWQALACAGVAGCALERVSQVGTGLGLKSNFCPDRIKTELYPLIIEPLIIIIARSGI